MVEDDPQPRGWQSWFRERKLAQVLFVYAGASWAVLEVTDVFIDKLGLRDYAWVSDLLEGCDPEFQPQRELAQRAMEQLSAETR